MCACTFRKLEGATSVFSLSWVCPGSMLFSAHITAVYCVPHKNPDTQIKSSMLYP